MADWQTAVSDMDPKGEPENPASLAQPRWLQVIDEMEATAEAYRDRGWEAEVIHPGDVVTFTEAKGRQGLELLAPDNEFDAAAGLFDACDGFSSAEVYRAVDGATVYLVIALEDTETGGALCLPAYYSHADDTAFVKMLRESDAIPIHVRPLDERRILTFSHQDPSLLLPDE